jgi:hypothetical protein
LLLHQLLGQTFRPFPQFPCQMSNDVHVAVTQLVMCIAERSPIAAVSKEQQKCADFLLEGGQRHGKRHAIFVEAEEKVWLW